MSSSEHETVIGIIATLNKKAVGERLDFSKYARQMMLKGKVENTFSAPKMDQEALKQIKGMANNVNQITKRINSFDKNSMDDMAFQRLLNELNTTKGQLTKLILTLSV